MLQELVYTSSESGLLPGSRGFCTVAMTQGMAQTTRILLESLSGYAHIFTGHNADYLRNPVTYSHLKDRNGNSILSRISACEFDYTGRTNNLAHHIFWNRDEKLPLYNPAALMLTEEVMFREWTGPANYLPPGRLDSYSYTRPVERSCQTTSWMSTKSGVSGAAVLAKSFEESQRGTGDSTVYLCFGVDEGSIRDEKLLTLINEALTILPENLRGKVTFSTYFTALPVGMQCDWRCVLRTDPSFAKQSARAIWIDLETGEIHNAEHLDLRAYTQIAKSGNRPASAKVAAPQRPAERVEASAPRVVDNPRSVSPRSVPTQNTNRGFDVERYRREQEAKVRRENRFYGIAIAVVVAVVVLVGGAVLMYTLDTGRTSEPSEQNGERIQKPSDAYRELVVAPTNPQDGSVAEKSADSKNAEIPNSTPSTNAPPKMETAAAKEENTNSLVTAETKPSEKEIRFIDATKDLLDGEWQFVAYFSDTNNTPSKVNTFNPRYTPSGDVLVFTKTDSPTNYVFKTVTLDWGDFFLSSRTGSGSSTCAPTFKVDKNIDLFKMLQPYMSVKVDVVISGGEGEGGNKGINLLQVTNSPKIKSEALLAMNGWSWESNEVKKFCESALTFTEYVPKVERKKIELEFKSEKSTFKFNFSHDDFIAFTELEVKGKKVPTGSWKKEVADKASNCLSGKALSPNLVEKFLDFIDKHKKDFDELKASDENAKKQQIEDKKEECLRTIEPNYTLSISLKNK